MAELKTIEKFLDRTLCISDIPRDASNNGLQVEGTEQIRKAVFSVDASVQLFEIAIEEGADFVFVHHGISWGDSLKRITGQNAKRIKPLIKNDISLYAAHLPLDAHPELGHNAQLASFIELENQEMFSEYSGAEIGVQGVLKKTSTPKELANILDNKLNSKHTIYGDKGRAVKQVGIISGGGSCGISDAAELGLDCFITGEIKHDVYHTIKELDIPVIALGHYCSEKPGVIAIMEQLSERFNIECKFIDIPTGL